MDSSFVTDASSAAHAVSSASSHAELEANSGGAISKSNSQNNIQPKKPGRFSNFRFSFKKRKNNVEQAKLPDESKKTKMSKKDTNKDKKEKTEKISANTSKSELMSIGWQSAADMNSTLKRQISKSSVASTLVRKISFGKLKVANRSRISPEISPTPSHDDPDSNMSSSVTLSHGGRDGDDGTPELSGGESSSMSDTDNSLDYLDSWQTPKKPTQFKIEATLENHRELNTSAGKSGGQSGESSPSSRPGFNQSESSKDLQHTNVEDIRRFYELEKDFQKPTKCSEVRSDYLSVSVDNVSSGVHDNTNFRLGANESATATSTALKRILSYPAESSTFVGQDREPVGIVEKSSAAVSPKLERKEVGETTEISPSDVHTTFAEKTFKVRTAWMSEQMDKVEDKQDQKQENLGFTKQTSTKSQILSITTPIWEKQKFEEAAKEIVGHGDEILSETSELFEQADDPVTTPTNIDASVAGSSKSDVYFTPRDSPSPTRMSHDADYIASPETPFYTPEAKDVAFVPAAEGHTLAADDGEPTTSGDDVMAEARAKLSHSLGIATTLATQIQVGDKREHLYKILVIGELGTGKTSIIKRYVHQFFSQHYRATIGVDFALKVLNWDANTIIRLQLWDIAGQERFGNMTRVYYKEAVGAFIVFDVTRAATFDAVVKWKQDLDSKVQLPDGSSIPCVLLANKCDQQKEGLVNNPGKMDEYCKEKGFSGWYETSAKENINIEEAARSLVTKILQNDQLRIQGDNSRDGDKFNLDGNKTQDEKLKSKCSC